MELRPITTIQTSIARQEDIKRTQQNELRAREALEHQQQYAKRLREQGDKNFVHTAPRMEKTNPVSINSETSQEQSSKDNLPNPKETDSKSEDPKSDKSFYFQDPNLGRTIDISG